MRSAPRSVRVRVGVFALLLLGCGASGGSSAAGSSTPADVGPPADAATPADAAAPADAVVSGLPDVANAHPADAAPTGDGETPDAADSAGLSPDAAACPPCPAGTVPVVPVDAGPEATGDCRCHDPAPWPAAAGEPLSRTLCLSVNVPGPGAHRDFFFARLAELGIATIRHEVRWRHVEPARGVFDFAATDEAVSAAESAGVELLAMLAYGNPWASQAGAAADDDMYPPDEPADFGRFAGAVAARYGERIRRYEIWNEQNAGYRFWKRPGTVSGDPVAYAALLRAAHGAIIQAAPTAQVAFGGLFYVPQIILGAEDFLAQSYAALPGHAGDFEAVAYHPYMPYPPRVPPEWREPDGRPPYFAVDETPDRLRAVMSAAGDSPAKPLWVTEYGWPTLSLTEAQQAQYSLRAHLMLWARAVSLGCLYTLMDSDPNADHLAPWEATFGLYTWDPTPQDPADGTAFREKTLATALRRVQASWGAARFSVDLSARYALPPTVRVLGFEGAGETRGLLYWSVDSPEIARIPYTGSVAEALSATNLVDGTTQVVAPPVDGFLDLPATPDPWVLTLPGR